jgi:hypothetical protein
MTSPSWPLPFPMSVLCAYKQRVRKPSTWSLVAFLLVLELAPRSCSCARHLFLSFLKLIKLKQGQETLERFNRAVVT